LNIDPAKIEAAITAKTSAIIATHVYGNPCDIEAIDTIAKKYNLKVIYDAAHGFGTRYKGKSIFEYGDISTASFHATKLFHTVEGGGVFTSDPDLLKRMAYMRNFGYDGPEKFSIVGIHGKNSELHAAMGLCVLSEVSEILKRREEQCEYYDAILENLNVKRPVIHSDTEYNHAYYPVIFESEEMALVAKHQLELKQIFTRRYFYPTLSSLGYVGKFETPVADTISKSVLCLPLYHTLSKEEQDMIARILLRVQNYLV
jgi:dTDP-4-amino-4,6-dideoxygalactose transaminase